MSCAIPAETIEKTIEFHGHSCPGLAIGIRVAELAMRDLGHPDEIEMVAVSETDMCGVDAIQFLTGCTYGKGNFMHRDYGKMAFSFYDRKSGNGLRVLLSPEFRSGEYAELAPLMKKQSDGTSTADDKERLTALREMLGEQIMSHDLEDLFRITPLVDTLPRPAKVLASLQCECCGESVMESRTRRFDGMTLCIPCFGTLEQKI